MWESDHKEGRPKNWCFQPVVLEKTLESPLDSKEIKPVNLKEINPEYSLMLKLKLQYFGQLIRRADSLEETLILGKFEGSRRRGYRGWDGWMTSLTWWTWVWANCGRWWRTWKPGALQSMGSRRVELGHIWLNNNHKEITETMYFLPSYLQSYTLKPGIRGPQRWINPEWRLQAKRNWDWIQSTAKLSLQHCIPSMIIWVPTMCKVAQPSD